MTKGRSRSRGRSNTADTNNGRSWKGKMNTELMGKLFGGNIAEVMGNKVARDEVAILAALLGG